MLEHSEGQIISILFVDARRDLNLHKIEKEQQFEHVDQYTVGIFMEEDAEDNSLNGPMEGLVGLKARRQSANEIYFKNLLRNDELMTLY